MSATAAPRWPGWLPWLICLAGLALKALELWVDPDLFIDYEVLSRGLLARELLDGPALHLLDYQGDPYAGASLVMGLVAVPLFALLGDDLYSLSLASFPFLAATAWATWALARRIDPRAAPLAMLLVFLAPYPASRLALVAWGDGVQTPLFVALALLVAWPLVEGKSRSPLRAGALGLIVGAGLYWHYHFVIPLVLLAPFLLMGDRGWLRRPGVLAAGLAGLLLGLAPWLAYNLTHRWEGLIVSSYGNVGEAGQGALERWPARFLALLFPVPAASLGPGPASWGWARALSTLAWIAGLLGAASLLRGGPTRGAWGQRYLLAYLPFFALAAAATPYSFDNEPTWYFADRYLSTLHWALLLLVALAAAAGWQRGGWARRAGVVLAGLFLWIGIGAQLTILLGQPPRGPMQARAPDGTWQPGWSWSLLADDRIAFGFYRGELDTPIARIRAAEGARRGFLGQALGMSLVWRDGADLSGIRAASGQLEASLERRDLEAFWRGVGAGVGRWHSDALPALAPALRGSRWEEAFLDGALGSLERWFGGAEEPISAFIDQQLWDPWRERAFSRLGKVIASTSKRDGARALARIEAAVPPGWQPMALRGLCGELGAKGETTPERCATLPPPAARPPAAPGSRGRPEAP